MRRLLSTSLVLVAAALAAGCGAATTGYGSRSADRSGAGGGTGASGGPGTGMPLPPCAETAPRTTGTTYYYCDCDAGCVPGDDSREGTSPSAPRRSFKHAVETFNGMKAGDTVAFCRGGSWTLGDKGWFTNTSCTAADPCDFRDYTPPGVTDALRPRFTVGAFDFVNATAMDGTRRGYRFWNLDVRHTAGTGSTFNLGDVTTDVDICNVNMEGGGIGLLEQQRNARITLRNSRIANYSGDGVLAGSPDLLIDSNDFVDNGPGLNRNHTIYLGGGAEQDGGKGPSGERILNNRIRVGTTSDRVCKGTIVTVHGRHTNTVIENNLIVGGANADGGCFGIQVVHGGYPYACWLDGTVIRRNRVYLQVASEGIGVTNCGRCVISDNVVAIQSGAYGIMVPESPQRKAVVCGDNYVCAGQIDDDSITTDVTVQNNTVYMPAAENGWNLSIDKEGSGYIVENNALFEGPRPAFGACLQVTRPVARDPANNYCRPGSGPTAEQLWVAPTFVETADYRPAAGSNLIGAGSSQNFSSTAPSATWSATDPGVARASPSDAGAFVH